MKKLGYFLSHNLLMWVEFFDLNELFLDIYCTFSFPYQPKEVTSDFVNEVTSLTLYTKD